MKIPSRIFVIVFLGTPLLLNACSDRGTVIVPENPQPPVLKVQPDSGKIGSIVAIQGALIITKGFQYTIVFPGADSPLVSDSTSDSTIFTFVPFGACSGPLAVYSDRLLGLSRKFYVTESPDTLALTVQRYDISPAVTAKDSFVVDHMGFHQTWRADLRGDSIHLHRGFSNGEDYFEYHVVLIDQGAIQLPRLLAVWTIDFPDYPGSFTDSIHVGMIKLQQYDRNGIIAGKFFTKPSADRILNGTFTFWVNVRQ